MDGVVPVAMELLTADVDGREFGVRHDDALGIARFIEFAAYDEAGLGPGRADQIDDDAVADQGPGTPVRRNKRE
jgi:hypothetical protein